MPGLRLTHAALVALAILGACGPPPPARDGRAAARVYAFEVPVRSAELGARRIRLRLGPPLAGELDIDLGPCEWAGSGAVRVDRACVGTFSLRTRHGRLAGSARALWTAYRTQVSFHGTVRTGGGCLGDVAGGSIERAGPVSFPTLAVKVRLELARGAAPPPGCLSLSRAPNLGAAVAAARAAEPTVSVAALRALAAALGSTADAARSAAAATLGFAASDTVYAAFRPQLSLAPDLLEQAERARELRRAAGASASPPLACDAEDAPEDALSALCRAARAGFEQGRDALVAALDSAERGRRRTAALLLVRAGGGRARPLLEEALSRALARGDLVAAVDLAEAALSSAQLRPDPLRPDPGS